MRELIEYFADVPEVAHVLQLLRQGVEQQSVTGLSGSARHLFYAALAQRGFSLAIAAHSMQSAQSIAADLTESLGADAVFFFPERELSHSDLVAHSPEIAALRWRTLAALLEERAPVVVTTIRALRQALPSPVQAQNAILHVRAGETLDLSETAERLTQAGYERAQRVEARGQFSIRGGIVDIYPLDGSPVRIELFDDEVDSIRLFEAESQRSFDQVKEARVYPVHEMLVTSEQLASAADRLERELEQQVRRVGSEAVRENLRRYVGRDAERMAAQERFSGLVRYRRLFAEKSATMVDYLHKSCCLVFDEPTRLRETMERVQREEAEWTAAALEHGEIVPGMLDEVDVERTFAAGGRRQVFVTLFQRHHGNIPAAHTVSVSMRQMQQFHGQLPLLKTELARFHKTRQHVVFTADSAERAERLARVLYDFSIEAEIVEHFHPDSPRPLILVAALSSGFELPSGRLVVIAEGEVFVNKRRAPRVRSDSSEAARIKSYQDLAVGDFVVHATHGIGRYMGLDTLDVAGVHRDFLHLRYAGNDKLYVPADQINQVQKYLGSEEREPRLHHLGGSEFARAKNKVRKCVRDIAEDLIKIYAQREAAPGYAFRPDTEFQRDFEATFPYDETPDQLRAIAEIKRDMERARPMDRLLCGDVGYGKTEVAIRAAAKAVFDGKQAAVLVPTTILAQQHFETFRERFSGFPVTVEVLSRFRSKTETKRVMQGLQAGTVDVVIGTHRLLNKGITFRNLGLLVVDEEQRFGVTHKEKLKELKSDVDCLTLTATPIPRTLHMSMVGVRDLSVIETAPENRFPVQTYVVEYSDGLLREAIEREIGRGGQVYVLYNQVKGIHSIAERVARLVPEARVAVGHGQMAEDELERVMLAFLEGETDVLVSTTIIEAGLDIANVNTLVVFHADRMGLSQLYQLRGRVGRSNRIAYAYFTYQPDKILAEVAEKRLQAIKEFTELGSGFKIAMRDLAIRGAGNLLGAEQHGFISSVGFDMYSDMLAEAVRELRGEAVVKRDEPAVEISADAYLGDAYISDALQKIEMYKKFVAVGNQEDVSDLRDELVDRFGDIPAEAEMLLRIARIRAYAFMYDLASVVKEGQNIQITLRKEHNERISGVRLIEVAQLYPRRTAVKSTGGAYSLTIEGRGLKDDQLLDMTIRVLEEFKSVFSQQEELQNAK